MSIGRDFMYVDRYNNKINTKVKIIDTSSWEEGDFYITFFNNLYRMLENYKLNNDIPESDDLYANKNLKNTIKRRIDLIYHRIFNGCARVDVELDKSNKNKILIKNTDFNENINDYFVLLTSHGADPRYIKNFNPYEEDVTKNEFQFLNSSIKQEIKKHRTTNQDILFYLSFKQNEKIYEKTKSTIKIYSSVNFKDPHHSIYNSLLKILTDIQYTNKKFYDDTLF